MNHQNTKVSVIVPVYNVERYITQCIDSLINQTLQEIEIILINDCSTDNSGRICEEYARKDQRIKVINNEKNIKQGLSRNKGIEIAEGEYLSFVDPDDWLDLDFYKSLYDKTLEQKYDVVKTGLKFVYDNDKYVIEESLQREIIKGIKKGKPLVTYFRNHHQTAIYRREFILQHDIKYAKMGNSQDIIFLRQVGFHAKSFSIIKSPYYYYRQHSSSVIHNKSESWYLNYQKRFRKELDLLNKFDLSEEDYNQIFYKFFIIVFMNFDELNADYYDNDLKNRYIKETLDLFNDYKFMDENRLKSILIMLTNDSDRNKVLKREKSRRRFILYKRKLQTLFYNLINGNMVIRIKK